jgi:hypothetical protein
VVATRCVFVWNDQEVASFLLTECFDQIGPPAERLATYRLVSSGIDCLVFSPARQ